MRCPRLVGRGDRLSEVRARIDEARSGTGGAVVVVGDGGSGKSRLVREALEAERLGPPHVLWGRAVASPNPVPLRPLTEAFQRAFRGADPPGPAILGGLAPHVGVLVPAWGDAALAAETPSPVVVAETAILLLRTVVADGAPAVLVVEDLHWADTETLDVVDLLADAITGERILLLTTTRPGGAADALSERLGRHPAASVVTIDPLTPERVDEMVAACLDVADAPPGLDAFVRERSDGSPFVVEELLAGLVASGDLRREGAHWAVGELRATVPSSVQASIHQRVSELDADAVRVLGASALLGRDFDWELLPGISEVDGRTVVDALRAATDSGLVEVRGNDFRFRHALTRDAVLAELLPPERRSLAARAWPVIERAHPGLPGAACELAAELAEVAGDRVAAVGLLVVSVQRALASGALGSAEATARRAVRVAAGTPASVDAEEALVAVLVAAGKAAEALSVGAGLAERLIAGGDDARVVDHHLTLARAAVIAGELTDAARHVDEARAGLSNRADPGSRARVDVLAAHVALDDGELARAAELATRARDAATEAGLADVGCDATLVLGRVARADDWPAALALFREAESIAADAGLGSWLLRAQQELAGTSWVDGDTTPLASLRATASRYGAVTTVALIDLTFADIALSTFDTDECRRTAEACVDASRRFHLATESVAHLWLAGAHALAGDEAAMQESIAAALGPDPDDPRILGDLDGRVLVTAALVRDDLAAIPALLESMAGHVRRAPPGTSVYPGRIPRAVLHALDDDPRAPESRAEVERLALAGGMPFFRYALGIVDAVTAGRTGDRAAAESRFDEAYGELVGSPLGAGPVHQLVLFLAHAAHRDRWGDPAAWLRAAEAWFAARGFDLIARRCRILLRDVGAAAPRRGRGRSEVPEALRSMGVTSREVDVLTLVAAGSTNREIAEELVLSPKTVERHLSNLFVRTGATNRKELVALTAEHLGAPDR